MKRILAVLGGLTALTILGLLLLRDTGTPGAGIPETATGSPAAAVPAPPDSLNLQMSRRLERPPTGTAVAEPAPAAPATGPASLLQPRSLRYLGYLLGALLIGMAMSLAWRKPAPVVDDTAVQTLRGELTERDEAIRALEVEFEQRVNDRATSLSEPLRYDFEAQAEELRQLQDKLQERDSALESHARQLEEQFGRAGDLEEEISAATQRADRLQRELAERERALDASEEQRQATLGDQDRRLDSLTQELATWKDSVSALEQELDERVAQVDALQQEKTTAQAAGSALQKECDQLRELVQSLRGQLEANATAARTERDEYYSRAETLDDSLHHRTQQIDSLAAQVEEKNALIDELRNAVEAGHQQILAVETELGDMYEYRDKLNSWDSTLQTLRADLERRDAVIDELRTATARLGQTEQQVVEQQKTIAALEAELDKSGELAHSLKRGADTMRHYKDIAEQRQETIRELHGDLQEANDEIDEWRNRIPPLEKAIQERDVRIDALQARLDRQAMDANDVETELADWRIKVTALETALRERDAGLDDLRTRVDTAIAERDRLGAELDETQEIRASLNSELERVSGQLQATTAELEQERREREKLADETQRLHEIEDRLQEWDSTVSTLRADVRERERTLHTLLDDFGTLIGDRVSVQGWAAALDHLRGDINDRQREIERYGQEVARLEEQAGQLPARDAAIEALEQSLARGRAENEQLQGRVADLAATVDSLREDSQEIERLQHELDERNADLEALRSELERNQNAILRAEELELGAENDRIQVAALRQDLRERDERIDDLEMDVADWIDKHARLKSRIESLDDQVAALKSQTPQPPEAIPTLKTRAPAAQSFPTLPAIVRRPPEDKED